MNVAARRKYLQQKIENASALGRIIILYDSCILFLKDAVKAYEVDNRQEYCYKLIRAQNIIRELRNSLNMDLDAKIGGNLYRLYTFFLKKLMEANRDRRPEGIQHVIDQLAKLNHAWQEAESQGLGKDVKRFEERMGKEDTNIVNKYKVKQNIDTKVDDDDGKDIKTLNLKI